MGCVHANAVRVLHPPPQFFFYAGFVAEAEAKPMSGLLGQIVCR